MPKLWKKSEKTLHPFIEKYTVGNDPILDTKLMPYDIRATAVHSTMLKKIGMVTAEELKKILEWLDVLLQKCKRSDFSINIEDEDCHTVIENFLTEKLGSVGKKIHTGRSRNDQVLTALRLLMKDHMKKIGKALTSLAEDFMKYGKKYEKIPMPGYSHTQQAMLTSVGHYMASFTESLLDDTEFLKSAYQHIDKNPLGSAAGFGVALPIDREFTTQALKFATWQHNSLYCQTSRGKFESAVLESMVQIMLTLGRFANDMILFTSKEFDFFEMEDGLVTGSSIMPHKRNPDALEILRGYVSVVIHHQHSIQDISKNLLSGYNRDLQLIKKPLIESLEIVSDSIKVVRIFLKKMRPKQLRIESKITPEIFQADTACALVMEKGIPFRSAYKIAAKNTKKTPPDFQKNIRSKISLGGPGNIRWARYEATIDSLRNNFS